MYIPFNCPGLEQLLVPWINDAEKTTNNPLEKPTSFENARELEMKCVKFAKVKLSENTKRTQRNPNLG